MGSVIRLKLPGDVAVSCNVSRSPLLPTTCTGTADWPALAESLTVKLTGTCVGPEVQGALGEMVTVALQVRLPVTLKAPLAPKTDTKLVNATVLPGVPENDTLVEPLAVTF